MKKLSSIIILSVFILITQLQAQNIVSPFEGSKALGTYETEFERLTLAQDSDKNNLLAVEGKLVSHIYQKPKTKSSLEVFRSYEEALKNAGFEMLSNSPNKRTNKQISFKIYGEKYNSIQNRQYKMDITILQQIQYFTDYYIAAKKDQNGKTLYVSVAVSQYKDVYVVDVLEVTNREQGTVKISVELLKKKIGAEGKYLIYSIYFDTGKAEILPTSNETLEVVANYLKNIPNKRFYIVGHTDDTGGFANNMDLSQRRAAEVVRALQVRYGISQNQIEAKGVGPLAPVDSNETIEGRNLNRRVELVLRLD